MMVHFIQCTNGIQGKKPSGRQWYQIIKYKKSTIDHAIYIKVFSDEAVYYPIVYIDDVLNTANAEQTSIA